MEIYPILIDGEEAGELTVDRQGPLTVFEAVCGQREGLIRLSVYGGGREGPLGLLAPEGGALRLRRSLSRYDMRDFPAEIERVERSGYMPDPDPEPLPRPPRTVEIRTESERETEAPREKTDAGECAPAENQIAAAAASPTEEAAEAESGGDGPADERTAGETPAGENSAVGEERDLDWYASPDGALVCFDGTNSLIALPPSDERVPQGVPGERRTVEGREYLVYRTKNGRIQR